METRRKIEVGSTVRKELMKLFGCSAMNVSRALNFKADSDECRRIRRAAIEKGGHVMNWMPECETIHYADGKMRQNFPSGAQIKVDYGDGCIVVTDPHGLVQLYKKTREMTLAEFANLQVWAASL